MNDNKHDFEQGNVVVLKSFPHVRMTVQSVAEDHCYCVWFNTFDELQNNVFHVNLLELSGL